MQPFDQREGIIFLHGEYVEWKNAKIHFLTHGLHYASLVYEGIRVYNQKPFKLQEHLDRLKQSAIELDFELPYSVDYIKEVCFKLIKENKLVEGYLRPAAWRGSERISTAAPNSSVKMGIACWEVNKNLYVNDRGQSGVKVAISDWVKPIAMSAPSKAKCSALYAVNTLAKHAALKKGFDDALLLDVNGNIAELSSANLFFIKNNQLFTPNKDYILNGITRQTVFSIVAEMGLEVIEKDIRPEELPSFSECFMTGTACEVKSIGSINNVTFESQILSNKISQRYHELTLQD